ncbi:unnamed protein product [Cercopithifilaria johnstoni]|uniref:Protein-serine/threonine kinase n=1 Tax=Cercopithifilaria johnstoni TaxID=2874296 RepID=A0A8J2M6Y1_9BILA|nr:unnamed protein product [Cercopithifilaria johnstoni]
MRLTRHLLQQFRDHMFMEKLKYYERFRPQPISLQMYLSFGQTGTVEISFKFLRKELLVRLANITKEVDLLFQNLPQTSVATGLHRSYCQSFEDLLPFENVEPTDGNISSFNEKVEKVMLRHENTIEEIAKGVIQLRQEYGVNIISDNKVQYSLDRLYFNTISIRILQHQHLVVFGTSLPESPRHIGCIDPACDVAAVIVDAYDSARFICDGCYCDTPKLQFNSYNSVTPGHPIAIATIPSYLYYIMFELFKNSMRATIDRYSEFEKLPPVQVLATLGEEDLTIRMSDSGGGISRRKIDQLFRYSFSTAPPPENGGHNPALAGCGYGLPLSRLYARYFHGDLMISSMEGYGTDAFLQYHLKPAKQSRNKQSQTILPNVSQPSG